MIFGYERIRKICDELEKLIYQDRQPFKTLLMKDGNFPSIEAVDNDPQPWKTYTVGDQWGGFEYHGWLRPEEATVPAKWEGQTVAFLFESGLYKRGEGDNPQMILYVDGEVKQGIDVNHREVILARNAKAGDSWKIDLHGWGSRGGRKGLLEVDLVLINERVRKLYYDISVPLEIANSIDGEEDYNKIKIISILNDAINLIDLRVENSDSFYASVETALEFLEKNLYGEICGHEDMIATCVGHTHIDVAWLWTLAQTREKTIRSFSTVLNLMEEFPEYIFMSSQPQLYKFLKEDKPEVYARLKQAVADGRWEPDGAMWVEADCNISSGEALVRQVMFGQDFFQKEFGIKNTVLWLPDVFGYSAAIPQILKKSGIDYFMTTKISWNQFNQIPNDTFMWKGIDGSEVLTHFITTKGMDGKGFATYNGYLDADSVMGGWKAYKNKEINNDVLLSIGWGDGGGGTTKDMIEIGRRMNKGIPGCPKVQWGKAGDYFKRLDETVSGDRRLPKWVGELYFEYHRGTYTSIARNKRYNRKSEYMFTDAELLAQMANSLTNAAYPQKEINDAWEIILLNQFHDILPGSSIFEVYEDSRDQYEAIKKDGQLMIDQTISALTANMNLADDSIVVFNTLSYERSGNVMFDLPADIKMPKLVDSNGNELDCQIINTEEGNKVIFYADAVPAKGYKSFKIADDAKSAVSELTVSANHLENAYFSIDLDECANITSLYDKVNERQVIKEGERANVIQAFEDRPLAHEAWDIDIYYTEKMWEVNDVTSVSVIEEGPVRGTLRIEKSFCNSKIVQDMHIYNNSPRIDFDTYIDWKEHQVLLKAAFPVDVHSDKATFDIQYGNVERPTHKNTSWDTARFEVCAHKWTDLSEDGYGVSILNDCKYGHDIFEGVMRLTMLKSGIQPNPVADQEEHRFTYSIYPHGGDWKAAKTVQLAYDLNVPMYTKYEKAHDGQIADNFSYIKLDSENVICEVVKKAENDDSVIVRVYESYNRRTKATAKLFAQAKKVSECDLMEDVTAEVAQNTDSFEFTITPYEIKTFKVEF